METGRNTVIETDPGDGGAGVVMQNCRHSDSGRAVDGDLCVVDEYGPCGVHVEPATCRHIYLGIGLGYANLV